MNNSKANAIKLKPLVHPKKEHSSYLRLVLCCIQEPDGCWEQAIFKPDIHCFQTLIPSATPHPKGRNKMSAWPG